MNNNEGLKEPELTYIIAKYGVSFSGKYVLGNDSNIYRLAYEDDKGRFHGIKLIKPRLTGKKKKIRSWSLVMPEGNRATWYESQIKHYFVKLEKQVVIKTINLL